MRKQFIMAAVGGMIISGTAIAQEDGQTLQQFNQEDFNELMRSNPELLGELMNPDGTIDRIALEEVLRDQYNYVDSTEFPAELDFSGVGASLYSERTQEELENDIALQKRLAEEREKAYEAYKKKHGPIDSTPPGN